MDLSKVDPEDRLEEQMLALEGMLRREFSQDELHRLAASFVTLPVDPKKWSDFQSKLVCATIDCFLDSGDRGGLTVLLAVRCPRRAIRLDIEDRLAVSARTFKDPITVLGEAYAKSKIPETRQAIAEAARRAFTGSGIRGKDDGEFIENAMRWYRANKRRLEVNWHYGERSTSHNGEDYDTNPLFVPRAENSARKPSV